jgi:two-component system alkaline phosphatase synthesis response regulator PhoP
MKKIILAEDVSAIAKIVIHKLQNSGYNVKYFNNGEGVVEAIIEEKPSLLITDIMMPIKDGMTILKEVKSNPTISNIPVIILTGNREEDSVVRGFKNGAADYIRKPFSTAELLLRVKKALNE